MWFKKKNSATQIIQTVTKTSSQSFHEKQVDKMAENSNRKCPECGFSKPENSIEISCRYEKTSLFGIEFGNVYFGECEKCGTKWNTEYRT